MTDISIPGVDPSDVAAGRRPRNRKATIGKVAAALFAESGFDAVRMDDIAAASGITVRALYRHYTNKTALLTELVESSQHTFVEAIGDIDVQRDSPDRFAHTAERLAVASEDTTHFAVLWQREARHVAPDDYIRLRARLNGMIASVGEMIDDASHGLTPFQRELRAWATITIVVVPRAETDSTVAVAAVSTLLHPPRRSDLRSVPLDGAGIAADETISRRERLLAAAGMSIGRSGFASAGIDDIGRPAGVSGASLYRHFSSKTEILDTLAGRRASWLWFEADSRWTPTADPEAKLLSVTESYVAAAVRAPHLVGIWITENGHLGEPTRRAVGNSLSAFHSTWSSALQHARPDLTAVDCAKLVRIATHVVDDTVRIRHLVTEPGFAAEMVGLITTVFLDFESSTGPTPPTSSPPNDVTP